MNIILGKNIYSFENINFVEKNSLINNCTTDIYFEVLNNSRMLVDDFLIGQFIFYKAFIDFANNNIQKDYGVIL